ncbi:hypothetical protein V8G54_012562 [Vigna mungo]|uniref:25S rRNA (uridine-N(3))-methyltransferase BMT5-like domain-containing protein n=1 Tax=Vigna mungo TaxID=3915 RepID=A0AAQ3NRE5_VIGMU
MRYLEAYHNMKELEELGCTILTEFNPKTMAEHPLLRPRKLHKNVVRGFLQNAKLILTSKGEIHITLKEKHLFTLWDIERLASVEGLKLVGEAEFDPALYPGYSINSGFVIGEVRTFKFSLI